MEYIVSARKYRPMTFDSVVGQNALTTTLKNAVMTGKLAHAYLFCGPRGVGKTTCARIFAKVINCTSPTSSGDACGQCESCKAFNEGRSLNIFELDAASNNGVEHIKALMEQTRIPPQTGKYKVFIIDEVHMLSTAAFNAFLKTLEEPPKHVIFILATTEKHKILPTIISRCQIYDFERMSVQGIINHLKNVAEKEGYTYEEEALNVIAEKADGGMRDALSIFDQAASFCQGNITYQKVLEDLNILDADNYFKIVDLSLENKVSDIMLAVNDILSHGFDAGRMVNGLASHIRNVLMAKNPGTDRLIEASETQRQRYAEQAQRCTPKFLYTALRILNECDVNYRQSSNKRLLAELTLIQVAQITQEDEADGVGRRPCKRLKSLFKKIMEQLQQSAQPAAQVAGTASTTAPATVVAEPEPQTQPSTSNPKPSTSNLQPSTSNLQPQTSNLQPPTSNLQPPTSIRRFGTSFRSLSNQTRKGPETQSVGHVTDEKEQFTDDDLRREWLSMCNRMMQNRDFSALGKRMRNVQVQIKDFPHCEGICENTILKADVDNIMPRIMVTLMKALHNGQMSLETRIGQTTAFTAQRLSPREFFEKLTTQNSAFATFVKELQLEVEQ